MAGKMMEVTVSREGAGCYVLFFDGKPVLSIDVPDEVDDALIGPIQLAECNGTPRPDTLGDFLETLPDTGVPCIGIEHRDDRMVNFFKAPYRLYHK